MAAGSLVRGGGPKRNDNAPLGGIPFGERFVRPTPSNLENMKRHDKGKRAALNVHPSAPDFILGTFLNKRWQRNHTALPILGRGIEGANLPLVNDRFATNVAFTVNGMVTA